jgi:hypothetical protein
MRMDHEEGSPHNAYFDNDILNKLKDL